MRARLAPACAAQVVVLGGPREHAHAKHNAWVLQRRALELSKPPSAAEVPCLWLWGSCACTMELLQVS